MKKLLTITRCLILIALSNFFLNARALEQQNSGVTIEKSTFLKAISPVEISSNFMDIGDEVTFVNESDMYIGDINAIPRGSKLLGIVEDLKEPVQGTNSSMKLKITKIITPDKKTIPVNAYVYSENDNYIGGEQTTPMYYNKTPSYTEGWRGGILQYTPSNIRFPGQYTVIKAGSELFIILLDDLKIN